ncbi:hypothetical protein [Psychrobacter sp. I-STPA6b]|uniref:hypothetical protein n=1 Tax=Psychrobacter sp. I-STPA6b TaxID=2585718 RepID=UPI001D0CCE34|nr:hypothetical protein [Psychrobacter sp. I-STPA6b]
MSNSNQHQSVTTYNESHQQLDQQRHTLSQSTSYQLQELLKQSDPEKKKNQLQELLSKKPNLLKRMIQGKPDPELREFYKLSYKEQLKQLQELEQLAHQIKIGFLREQAETYLQTLSMHNLTSLSYTITSCIDEVSEMVAQSNHKFAMKFDKRMGEIDSLYTQAETKEFAAESLRKQLKLQKKAMDELLKKATKSLKQRLPSDAKPYFIDL